MRMKKFFILLFLIVIVAAVSALVMLNDSQKAGYDFPTVRIAWEGDNGAEGEAPYKCGFAWPIKDPPYEGYLEKCKPNLQATNIVQNYKMAPGTEASISIEHLQKPEKIVVKVFSAEEIGNYNSGKILSKDYDKIVCYPGYVYAIEAYWGEQYVVCAFKCV